MNLVPSSLPPASDELVDLVNRYLDQRLTEEEGKRLEELLRDDPQARAYCAECIRLHLDLRALERPLRIEIREDRGVVIEQRGAASTVTVRHTGQVNVEPTQVVAGGGAVRKWYWAGLAGLAVFLVLGVSAVLVLRMREDAMLRGSAVVSIRPLENASFEAEILEDGEVSDVAAGWSLGRGERSSVVINPGQRSRQQPVWGAHLPVSEAKVDGANVLALARTHKDIEGWAKQKIYGETALGPRALQLADIDGRVIRVAMTLARPSFDSGEWAANSLRLAVGIQEQAAPWRMAALYQIDTGSNEWEEADLKLGLGNDELRRITFDLFVDAGEMRGDAYLIFSADESSARGSEVFIDEVELEIVEE